MSDQEDNYFDDDFSDEEEFSEDEEDEYFGESDKDEEKEKCLEKEEKVDDEIDEEVIIEVDIPEPQYEYSHNLSYDGYKKADKNKRITLPILTKYEKTKVIGTRSIQISNNAQIYVDYKGLSDPILIAKKELDEGKIPFIIRRYLPNNKYEDWALNELRKI